MKKSILCIVACVTLVASMAMANDKVYASVNGAKITNSDLSKMLGNRGIKFESLPKVQQKKVIEQAIRKELLTSHAIKSGVEKSSSYKKALKQVRSELALEIWMQKEFSKVHITTKEEKTFYNKNKAKFKTKESVSASHILVKTKKEAEQIIKTLEKSKNVQSEFAKLAKAKSVGPTGKNGGNLGKFNPKQMVPAFAKAVNTLKVGTFTKTPVKTQFGYHVIYLQAKQKAKIISFSTVKKRIAQALKQEKFAKNIKKLSENLSKKAKITIKK